MTMIEREYFTTVRDLVNKANELKLDKKDIISILGSDRTGYFLIYQPKTTKKSVSKDEQ